jgi:DNA-binding transcriptional ArsR family regulator
VTAAAAVRRSEVTGATAAVRRPRVTAPQPAHQTTSSHPSHLDRVIHDRTRLAIMSALAVNDILSFTELKTLTDTTDGNLSVHARKLEEAGYVHCDKSFAGRTPRTDFRLSASGRRALEKYLDHMEALIRATRRVK